MNSHSDAFEKFVTNTDDDLEGMIAYALYKQQKRELIKNKSLSPEDIRVKEYHFDLNDSRVEVLKHKARAMLDGYAAAVVDITRESISKEVFEGILLDEIKNQHDLYFELSRNSTTAIEKINSITDHGFLKMADKIDATNKSIVSGTAWWKSVLSGVVASFVFGLVLTSASIIDWTNPFKSSPPPKTAPTDAPATPPHQ